METIENKFGIKLIGDSRDAEAWVTESTLDDHSKTAFLRLIRRFPSLRYQRWREIRSNFGPPWLRSLRMALDGVNAAGPVWMQFDQPDPFYEIHEQPAENIWYHHFLSYNPTSEYAAVYCGEQQLIFVGHWQAENYFLAINADDEHDRRVYALHDDHISPNDGKQASNTGEEPIGQVAMDDMEIAFDSYADLFGHIAALKIGDTIIAMADASDGQSKSSEGLDTFIECLKQGDVEFYTRHQEDEWGCRYLGEGQFEYWRRNYQMDNLDERKEFDEAGVIKLFAQYPVERLQNGLIARRAETARP